MRFGQGAMPTHAEAVRSRPRAVRSRGHAERRWTRLPLRREIALVADEQLVDILRCIAINLVQPRLHLREPGAVQKAAASAGGRNVNTGRDARLRDVGRRGDAFDTGARGRGDLRARRSRHQWCRTRR